MGELLLIQLDTCVIMLAEMKDGFDCRGFNEKIVMRELFGIDESM